MNSLRKLVMIVIFIFSVSALNVYAEDSGVSSESFGSKTSVEHPAAPAEETGVSGSIGSAVFYNYVWRGMLQHSGMAIQPDLNVGYKGLTLDVWNDFKTDNNGIVNSGWFETDFTLSYTLQSLPENLSLTFGAIAYTVTGANEVYDGYATLGYKTLADLSLSIYAGNSVPTSSVFTILHALHSFELVTEKLTFDPCLAVGTDYVSNTYGEIAVPLNYTFSKHLTGGATFVLDAGNKTTNRPDGVISYGGVIITANL